MTVRILKENEIDEVMRIWLDSTIAAHDFIPKEYWEKNYDLVKDAYIPNSETFVYEENEVIKGFISIIDKDFIGAIFVDPDFQGRGIGKDLISYVKDRFDGLALNVYSDNIKAVKFYESQGFRKIEEQTEESTGKKELLMKLE